MALNNHEKGQKRNEALVIQIKTTKYYILN